MTSYPLTLRMTPSVCYLTFVPKLLLKARTFYQSPNPPLLQQVKMGMTSQTHMSETIDGIDDERSERLLVTVARGAKSPSRSSHYFSGVWQGVESYNSIYAQNAEVRIGVIEQDFSFAEVARALRLASVAVRRPLFCPKRVYPHDGVLEHKKFEDARTRKKDLCLAWLDVTNAFGALPHCAIDDAPVAAQVGGTFRNLINCIYEDCGTRFLTSEGLSENIKIGAGIKQGCTIKLHQHCLQSSRSNWASAEPNDPTAESMTLHISGVTPVDTRNSVFSINGEDISSLPESDFHKYLGKPIGFNPCPNYQSLSELAEIGMKLSTSSLAPWQRIDALKSFLYPAFQFPVRTGQFKKTDCEKVDKMPGKEMKATLNLPQKASNDYLYGHRQQGCIGRGRRRNANSATFIAESSIVASILVAHPYFLGKSIQLLFLWCPPVGVFPFWAYASPGCGFFVCLHFYSPSGGSVKSLPSTPKTVTFVAAAPEGSSGLSKPGSSKPRRSPPNKTSSKKSHSSPDLSTQYVEPSNITCIYCERDGFLTKMLLVSPQDQDSGDHDDLSYSGQYANDGNLVVRDGQSFVFRLPLVGAVQCPDCLDLFTGNEWFSIKGSIAKHLKFKQKNPYLCHPV
ncbi:retrovirus-related Pol polyprotein from type-1 retrotransposable element R2 [Caerostris extrusa]|uniref:Retrovirus-related Pol polyprotein from type-1 retrotransposable element R2 n=1 Tax=Caerostris extrusa TaxID=172846 RepID=A0AAV4QQV8_CAEEX|nr:retrovirus-related Pol polyprotein from type-1 retrotransposable element R2 [Caerostris extrusa]